MKTEQIVFNNVSYGRVGTSSEQTKSIHTRNANLTLEADFERRVVWVHQGNGGFHYCVPFEALTMIAACKGDAEADVVIPEVAKASGRSKRLSASKAATA